MTLAADVKGQYCAKRTEFVARRILGMSQHRPKNNDLFRDGCRCSNTSEAVKENQGIMVLC